MINDEDAILTKKQNVIDVFNEVSSKHSRNISMKDVKKGIKTRYEKP